MAELSKNFEKQMDRLELPSCYGKHKTESKAPDNATDKQKKDARIKCGMCWFAHDCKAGARRVNDKKTGGSKRAGKAQPELTDSK